MPAGNCPWRSGAVRRASDELPWKPWLRRARRIVEQVKEHGFENFTVEWLDRNRSPLNTLSGVIEWMEQERRVTVPLMIAIQNTERAVRRMIRRKEAACPNRRSKPPSA